MRVGVIGAGGYVTGMLLPQFKKEGTEFVSVATASGVTAVDVGRKFGFKQAASAADEIINDDQVNLLVIGTRHDLHSELAAKALRSGKHVFVEKPLALNDEQLDSVLRAASEAGGSLAVGFNRRFAPLALKAKEFFSGRQAPLSILYRVNAGRIPRDHWVQDPVQGGGRIIGEVCHFIDLMQYLTGSVPISVFAEPVASDRQDVVNHDSVFITIRFADGSNGAIAYLAEGDKLLAKERVEIFGEGKTFVIDDFLQATAYRNGREEKTTLRSQDKGQAEEVKQVCAMVLSGGAPLIPLNELAATTRATFRILDSLRTGQPKAVVSSQ